MIPQRNQIATTIFLVTLGYPTGQHGMLTAALSTRTGRSMLPRLVAHEKGTRRNGHQLYMQVAPTPPGQNPDSGSGGSIVPGTNIDPSSTKLDALSSPMMESETSSKVSHAGTDERQDPGEGVNNIISAKLTQVGSQPMVSIEEDQEVISAGEPLVMAPGVKNIIKFAIPAIGVWLCGPLLSLIDTAAVGLFAGTAHQAALSPAVAVTDYASLLLAFLYAATTNLVAAAKGKKSNGLEEYRSPESTLLSSLQLSLAVGTGLGVVTFATSKILLRALIGTEVIDPAVFIPAVKYVKIRSLGMPAAAVLGSAQAACLGLKDIKSPLMVLGSAAAINLLGDIMFVPSKYALLNGAAGAAWATVASQYTAVVFFLHWLKTGNGSTRRMLGKAKKQVSKMNPFNNNNSNNNNNSKVDPKQSLGSILRTSSTAEASKSEAGKAFSVRGFLASQGFRKRHVAKPPGMKAARDFIPYLVPVTTTSVGRVSLFLAMAHVVSCCMGAVGMAAQQIIMALFEALCPIVDSLSLTAQSFVPALHEQASKSEEGNEQMKIATRQFFTVGGIFGAGLVGLVGCIPLISRLFTTDPLVAAQVNAIAPYLASIFAMHGTCMATEGILLGRRDLNFMGGMYGMYFALVPALMLRLKKMSTVSVQNVWQIFVMYQVSRMVLWMGRAMMLNRRSGGKGKETSQEPPALEQVSTVGDNVIEYDDFVAQDLMKGTLHQVQPARTLVDTTNPFMGRNNTVGYLAV